MALTSFRINIEVCLYIRAKKEASGDGLVDHGRSLRLRRKHGHDLPAAGHHPVLVERIERLLALMPDVHQACLAQDGEVMRDRGLRHGHLFHELAHRAPAAEAQTHDLLPCFIGDGFGEPDRRHFGHIDSRLSTVRLYRSLSMCQEALAGPGAWPD